MEENRLQPMVEGYDEKLFNKLYQETEPLRRKLAGQIDARRFGLFYDDILSFFDVKFIFCFNKHYNEPPNKLKAFLLNSLSNFKNRILRNAYTVKNSQNIVSFDTLVNIDDSFHLEPDYVSPTPRDYYYEKMMHFMKHHLSDNAYLLLEVQLNPPPYILKRINKSPDSNLQKIPDLVLLKYFGLGKSENAHRYLNKLKKEIRSAVQYAKTQLN